jgi:sigma-E factor negative regulatory protein RseB
MRTLAALLAGLLGLAAPAAADEASIWLRKMAQAARALDYHGTLVYAHGESLESLSIAHRATPEGERERIEFLTGEPREIVRDGSRVACLLPRQHTLLDATDGEHPLSLARLAGQTALAPHYLIKLEGEDRVAGRAARILVVQPKDGLRYGYRLWLDAEHGLLLRSALQGADGQMLEQMMFTSLNVGPLPAMKQELGTAGAPAAAEPRRDGAQESSTRDRPVATQPAAVMRLRTASGSAAAPPAFAAQRLPPGFALVSSSSQQLEQGERTLHRLVYSDGLATISVYVEPSAEVSQLLHGTARRGGVQAFGTSLGTLHVTALGEVPPAAVEMVARSVVPAPTQR